MPEKLNRLRELRRHLAATVQGQGSQQSLEHLQNLTEELRGPVDGIVRLAARCRLLGVGLEEEALKKPREKLTDLRTQFMERPASVGQGTTFKQCKESLGDLNASLREIADAAWTARRSHVISLVPPAMLSLWETIPTLRDDALEVRRMLGVVQAHGRPIQELEPLRAFIARCDDIEKRAEALNSFDAPRVVTSFLTAARTGPGAPWSKLTREVQEWLREHNLLDSVRIKLG